MKYLVERRLRDGAGLRRTRARHRSYWQRMARHRVLLYIGVWAEGPGDTLLVQVKDPAALRQVLNDDPYAQESLVVGIRTRRLGDDVLGWDTAGLPDRSAAGAGTGTVTAPDPGLVGGLGTVSALRDRDAAPAAGHGPLSAHESRITRMMLDGMTNQQMAACLGVSSRAVEQHITRIYRKLAISRRAQLAVALHDRPAA
ncbi:helix-turn-helix transcriptional regulator [Streptomyces sp. CoH27]|uniref:helix-turn-helix transcriptional regulator n=1 Tax=Streptomyces sp. CoH27 TaxID=2875763 RepID=UPI001CD26C3E|nr:helix-turn-helix transcriptional regulator [Streptomyces sp. CoH27]